MRQRIAAIGMLAVVGLVAVFAARAMSSRGANMQAGSQSTTAPAKPSPAEGYNVHVLAPHMVDGKAMGPYHHYCKVIAPDPQIQCLIYDSTDSNANLVQVEWIYAKKLTRNQVSLQDWNKNWHDHQIEIAGGRVQVLDMPAEKAKEVADLVSTTDGMIYHFYFGETLPNGKMSIAQAVGHKPMTAAEFKNYQSK
jgi:hypothetical protein